MSRRMTGQCDCCGRQRELSRVWAFGIETFACEECRGNDDDYAMNDYELWLEAGKP